MDPSSSVSLKIWFTTKLPVPMVSISPDNSMRAWSVSEARRFCRYHQRMYLLKHCLKQVHYRFPLCLQLTGRCFLQRKGFQLHRAGKKARRSPALPVKGRNSPVRIGKSCRRQPERPRTEGLRTGTRGFFSFFCLVFSFAFFLSCM